MPSIAPPLFSAPNATSCCGSFTASDFSSRPWISVKMAVLAPIPKPRDRTATAVKPGLLRSWRKAKRKSWISPVTIVLRLLFVAQRHHGIDLACPAGRDVARSESNYDQNRQNNNKHGG